MQRVLQPATVTILLAALSAMLFDARAAAQEGGALYVGGNFGYALSTYGRTALDDALASSVSATGYGLALSTSYVRDKQPVWSADIGYMISRYLSVEGSYLDLGTLRYFARGTETSSFNSTSIAGNLNISSRGPALALVGVLPMTNDWSVNARVGAYESKTKTAYRFAFSSSANVGSEAESSTTPVVGAGTTYVLGAHWVLRLDYLYLDQIKEKLLAKSFNVNLVTAGVAYAF